MSLATYLLLSPYHSGVFTAYSLQPRAYQQVAIPLADAFIYRTICFRVRLTVPTRNIPENIEGRPPQFRSRLSNTDLHWQGPIEPSDFSHQSGTVTAVSTYSVHNTNNEVEFIVVQRLITLPAYDAASQQVFGRTRAKHHLLQAISCAIAIVHRSKLKKPRKPECWTRLSRLGRLNLMQLTDTPCWRCHSGCVLSPPRDQPKIP
jgi:hypothetical protein